MNVLFIIYNLEKHNCYILFFKIFLSNKRCDTIKGVWGSESVAVARERTQSADCRETFLCLS